MDQRQFYPTPKSLSERAWKKFKERNFVRILEPNAGNGDIIKGYPHVDYRGVSVLHATVDVCEINMDRHATLRNLKCNVVGLDFLQFENGSIYSHIIMNPPFSEGAQHVLKAWDILWDGEIVAIVNAETIRNPYSADRKRLCMLVEQSGEVEYLTEAFMSEDTQRKTEVEIALIYLRKKADSSEIVGSILTDMMDDKMSPAGLSDGSGNLGNSPALANSSIENMVIIFKAAVRTMRESLLARARANYYQSLLGDTMAVRNGSMPENKGESSVEWVRMEISKEYEEIKDRAWTQVLRSSEVTSKVSSRVARELEAEFNSIKKLEFSVSNIRGFLLGLVQNAGQMQLDMACHVFDMISRYHEENVFWYKGWKSNSRHRTMGMRIKHTRFIIPHWDSRHSGYMSHSDEIKLRDFDKVFAMLDGKAEPDYGLARLFGESLSELAHGKRLASTYFEVRYYPGAGTIHFFPVRKDLIERLNRVVGAARAWIPQETSAVKEDFWAQYNDSAKFDKDLRYKTRNQKSYGWGSLDVLAKQSRDTEELRRAEEHAGSIMDEILTQHGISTEFQLQDSAQPDQQLLIAA